MNNDHTSPPKKAPRWKPVRPDRPQRDRESTGFPNGRKNHNDNLLDFSVNSSSLTPPDGSPVPPRNPQPGGVDQKLSQPGAKNIKMFWHDQHIRIVGELVPEQVRWFYREDSKSKWVPFIGYDSLRIECRHRAVEYSRVRGPARPNELIDTIIPCRGGLYEVDLTSGTCNPVYWEASSPDDVVKGEILRGTWFFEGTWQPLDDPTYASQIEIEHLSTFKGQPIPRSSEERTGLPSTSSASASSASSSSSDRSTKPVLHHIQFRDFHIDWYGVDEVYQFSESTGSRVFRSVSNRLGFKKASAGTRLFRGYAAEATMDDKPADIDHLVFVIHGIGQLTNTQRIVNCCNDLQSKVSQLQPKTFPAVGDYGHRVEFLPVEWRSDLQLDGGLVDSITPDKIKNLRQMLNSTAMDIMYYTSPLYRGEIISGLEVQLQRLYKLFSERNPYFEANNGKVSVVAHSLGCVILYDILTAWDPIELYDQYVSRKIDMSAAVIDGGAAPAGFGGESSSQERSKKLHDFYMKSIKSKQKSSLPFKVSNFFCLGSPLGVFLSLRGLKPQATGRLNHIMPKSLCGRIFNVYHPYDPIAYRLEPLVLKHYSTVSPLKVHKVTAAEKTPYTEMKSKAFAALNTGSPTKKPAKKSQVKESSSGSSDSSDRQQFGVAGASGTSEMAAASAQLSGFKGVMKGFIAKMGLASSQDTLAAELDDYGSDQEDERDDTPEAEQTDLEDRIDFVLPSGSMQNGYVGALFSHSSYWTSAEVSLFILSHVYPDIKPS